MYLPPSWTWYNYSWGNKQSTINTNVQACYEQEIPDEVPRDNFVEDDTNDNDEGYTRDDMANEEVCYFAIFLGGGSNKVFDISKFEIQ